MPAFDEWPSLHGEPQDKQLQDRVILITGASRGIGRTLARAFAREGAQLILLSRNVRALESLHEEIVADGGPWPSLYPFNLTSAAPDDYIELSDSIKSHYGRLDGLLLNAASLGTLTPLAHYPFLQWQQIIHTNLNSQFLMLQATLDLLHNAPDASIVLSAEARDVKAYWGAYAVAKQASLTLMQVLHAELEHQGRVRVNSLYPGPVATHLRSAAYPAEDKRHLVQTHQLIADYLYLIGPASRGLSGRYLKARAECLALSD